jgi:hypothetical protein
LYNFLIYDINKAYEYYYQELGERMRIETGKINVITKKSGEKDFYWVEVTISDIDKIPCESMRLKMAVPHKDGMSIDEIELEGLQRALEFLGRSKECLEKKIGT